MFHSPKIYTVHENAERAEPSERMELVREGFSVWAFLFNIVWLLCNKLWVWFFLYLVAIVALMEVEERLGLGLVTMAAIQIALQLLLGFSAHDIQRWALGRKGYRMTGIVVAESELLAYQRAAHA